MKSVAKSQPAKEVGGLLYGHLKTILCFEFLVNIRLFARGFLSNQKNNFCCLAGRACVDNAETQPLHDISTAPVPVSESEAVTASPDVPSSQRRAKYQNIKKDGDETVEFGATVTTPSATTGKAESEKKVNTPNPGKEKEIFTDAEDEVESGLGMLTMMTLTKRILEHWMNVTHCFCLTQLTVLLGPHFSLP